MLTVERSHRLFAQWVAARLSVGGTRPGFHPRQFGVSERAQFIAGVRPVGRDDEVDEVGGEIIEFDAVKVLLCSTGGLVPACVPHLRDHWAVCVRLEMLTKQGLVGDGKMPRLDVVEQLL